MNNAAGALNFRATIDLSNFRTGINQIRTDILGLTGVVEQQTSRMDSAFKNLSLGIAGYFSASALKGFVMELIDIRGEFQKTEIAFSTMLGNGGQAKQLMNQMVDLAAKTPFSLQDVSSGAKQLLAFQVPANEVVDTLTRMGNIAAGLSVPIQRINLVYGQVKAKGKLMGDDLRQFTEAGIPMVAELAKKFGKTTAEISAMVSAGKIGFKDVQDVLFSMTNEGGMFFNLMEQQSASLSGKISNLGDSFEQMLNKIGESQEGVLGQGIDALSFLIDHYKEVLNIIEGLVVVYGAYRAALITISAIEALRSKTMVRDIATMTFAEKMALGRALVTERQAKANLMEAETELAAANAKLANAQADKTAMGSIMASNAAKEVKIATTRVEAAQEALSTATKNASTLAEVRLTAAQQLRAAAVRALTAAEAFLNATMLSNPYVLATVAVVGLVYAYLKLRDTTTALEKAEKSMAENREKNIKILDELKSKTQEYLSILRSDYATNLQRYQAYEKMLSLYPDMLKNISMETFLKMEQLKVNKLLAEAEDKKSKDLLLGDIDATKEKIKNLKTILNTNGITGPSAKSLGLESHDWAGMSGYRKDLEGAEIQLKKQQFLLDRRNDAEKIANMTVEQRKVYYENEYKSLESQLFQHKQKNKHLKDADILTVKLGNSLSSLSVSSLLIEIKKAKSELSALQSAAQPVDKNKAFWEQQKKEASEANDAMSGKQIGGGDWNKNIKKIREADEHLKAYDYTLKKVKKETRQIAEILPVGSVKELQQRVRLLQEAKDLSINNQVKVRKVDKYGQDKDKSGKPYYTGEIITVEEAEKRIKLINRKIREMQTKNFSDEAEEIKRQISVRDMLMQQGLSKETVDDMFPKIKDKSFIKYLEESEIAIKKLLNSGKADEDTANNLKTVLNSIKEYKGVETYIEGVNNQIDVLKTKFSGSELISELDKFKRLDAGDSTEEERSAKNRAVEKAKNEERRTLESSYIQLLNDRKTFEEKKNKIIKDANDLRTLAKNDSELKKIGEAEKEQLSSLTVEAFRTSKDWETAFGELEYTSKSSLERILKQLVNFRQANKENLSVQDYKTISDKITEIQNRLARFDPLKGLISSYKNYRSDSEALLKFLSELEQANVDLAESYNLLNKAQSQEEFDAAMKKHDAALERRRRATEGVKQAEDNLSQSTTSLRKSLESVSEYFNQVRSVISSVRGVFDDLGLSMDNAFGDILDNLEQTMQGFEQMQSGLTNMLEGLATKNPIQAVAGGIQAIGGVIKMVSGWFNNDKKKERAIKREADALRELKSVYEDLAYAASKALGGDKYDADKKSLQNIKDQQARLREMYRLEADKKKSDKGKMQDYQEQIKVLDRQYQDLVDSIAKDFLQTDAKDLASQFTDGLVEALTKGEDALDSLDKKANDVFANMAKAWVRSRLEKSMGSIFDEMMKASGINKDGTGTFNPLTPQQMEEFKERMKNATLEQQKFLEQYKEFFESANASSPKGLDGAIKGMSEQTADVLVGQFNALRINTGEIIKRNNEGNEIMRNQLSILSQIKGDTSNLVQIRKDISELNAKVTSGNGLRAAGL
ncbi:tape measure protein [Elizabethkingia meningoseptica]|uniref:tape measure protein n=1 Tax=Elizabethkingia meningoseptica TaxID=238 RepID=UPI0031587849